MKKSAFYLFILISLASCRSEERKISEQTALHWNCQKVGFYYTTNEIPAEPRNTIDIELTGCAYAKDELTAQNIATRVALYALEKADPDRVRENQEIRITFFAPDFPHRTTNNYYAFKIDQLRKATYFLNLSTTILESYYSGQKYDLQQELSTTEIARVDSLLAMNLSRQDSCTSIEFVTVDVYVHDSTKAVFTALANNVFTKNGYKTITILFENTTNKVVEINCSENDNEISH
jgi:hypothetical protein